MELNGSLEDLIPEGRNHNKEGSSWVLLFEGTWCASTLPDLCQNWQERHVVGPVGQRALFSRIQEESLFGCGTRPVEHNGPPPNRDLRWAPTNQPLGRPGRHGSATLPQGLAVMESSYQRLCWADVELFLLWVMLFCFKWITDEFYMHIGFQHSLNGMRLPILSHSELLRSDG